MRCRGISAFTACLLAFTFVQPALATFGLTFTFEDSQIAQGNSTNSMLSDNLLVAPAVGSPLGITGSFTTPDGRSMGSLSGYSTAERYNSFSDLQAGVSNGPWSLIAVQGGDASIYTFSPDLTGISLASVPTVKLISPASAGTTVGNSRPTFTWSDTGVLNDVAVDLYSLDGKTNYFEILPTTQTSWTAPVSLPAGNYDFTVQAPLLTQTVPMLSTLISGPALNMPTSATFNFDAEAYIDFSVAPEPSPLLLLTALASPLLVGRRRHQP